MRVEKCRNCTHYSAYYKKMCSSFSRLNYGYCALQKEEQQQFDTCDGYTLNIKKEKRQMQFLIDNLENTLNSINQIALILKEKAESEDYF